MTFESVRDAAKRLNVTSRTVQKWATQGKIKDAKKVGRDWMIPKNAHHPGHKSGFDSDGVRLVTANSLPLLSGKFIPGEAKEYIASINNSREKLIAEFEYLYYIGDSEGCISACAEHIDSHDSPVRFSAILMSVFSNLSLDRGHVSEYMVNMIKKEVLEGEKIPSVPELHAIDALIHSTCETQFHIKEKTAPDMMAHLKYLPEGLKLFAYYVLAYEAYLEQKYEYSLGIIDSALMLENKNYPLAVGYLQIVAVMDLMSLMRVEEAGERMRLSWETLYPDRFFMPYVEHYGMFQGALAKFLKKEDPESLKKINRLSERFNGGWYDVYSRITSREVATTLTTTEFMIAMLYNRQWRVKEIAAHLELSERTIQNYIQIIYEKLGINNKKGLHQYMLS